MRNPGVYFEYLESGKKCSEASVPTWGGGGVGVGELMPSQCIPGYGVRQRDTFHCPLTRARLSQERGCWAGASLARTLASHWPISYFVLEHVQGQEPRFCVLHLWSS